MSLFVVVTNFVQVLVNNFWTIVGGGMLHKALARLWYFPSILRMVLTESPQKRWYDRIDSTVILGALPFKSQTKKLVEDENVKAVLSYNEEYELKFFTNSKQEWTNCGVKQHVFPTTDFNPPSLVDIDRGLRVIRTHKDKGETVYIHCKAGKGRSAIVTTCYLLKDYGYSTVEAIERIRSKRPQINMNVRQTKQIEVFHEQLVNLRD